MDANPLPQEPQTPAPENLEPETPATPETTTAPVPSPVREDQDQVTDCPNTCLFAYMLGGTILGVVYGFFCIPMLLRLYAQTQHKIIEADWLLVVSFPSVALLGGLGIATSVILGKRMAAVKGAFWRWFYYGVIGAGIGAAVGALLMWGTSLVLPMSPNDDAGVFFVVAGGILGCLFGSIPFATVGCQLYCADGPDSKKAIRNSTSLGIAACVASSIALLVISVLFTLPQDRQMPPHAAAFLTLLFVFMAVATGSMLGVVMPKKYAKIGAGTGLLLGAVLGGVLGFVFGKDALYGVVYGTALGALIGVLSGALVGALIDGTVDGEAVFAAGCAESAAWVISWPVFFTSPFAGPSLFLSMALLAILFGFVGKTFGAQVVWGTGGKTGTLLGAALGMVLGLALGIWQVTLLEEPSFELECILFIVLVGVQCLTIGMTLGAGIGVTMDRRRQRSSVSELPTDSTL